MLELEAGTEGAYGMVTCSSCGATAESPLGWTTDVTDRGPQYLCDRCSRENLRSIEGRLDTIYW
jgi:DNA-directed RNA polymerase subunit RPC12/RpoP